ncbi:DUF1028 domain-containing protein [Sabulicella glaciei]|uniref:DUF1028 domain-containing protein n=1 Tax=Sabulicella glaciei TaxID=2984948 RepID=A0ABT3P1Q9_9PROT|nr:DUF1028 domain-containing protein [Roseococcus sp. MDT2-1-1]MCW8088353.1 DUF1028 domain-containing protein [Roseococcus sp. MDT2-1-1]
MTFSLLIRCPRTGAFGAAVTTSSPAVGARVPWTAAGQGAVLTQARTDMRLGPRGLALLASGCTAEEAVAALVATSPHRQWRQVAVLDAAGRTAHWTGPSIRGVLASAEGPGCVAIGNILSNDRVPRAMLDAALAAAEEPLAERLLRALEAGEAAGGEGVPLVSAALRVQGPHVFPDVDLRVDFSPRPLAALRETWEAYAPMAELYLARALEAASG